MANNPSRTISTSAIKHGQEYDQRKIQMLQDHVDRLTSEVQRLMALVSGGDAGQVLTKTTARDYDATWKTP